jgi:hypothetical protein
VLGDAAEQLDETLALGHGSTSYVPPVG